MSRREIEETRAQIDRLTAERDNITARLVAQPEDSGLLTQHERLDAGVRKNEADLAELVAKQAEQHARIRELAKDPDNCEHERSVPFGIVTRRAVAGPADPGLRTIERSAKILSAPAADRLERAVRADALDSRYIEAVADEHYATAFGKMLADPVTGHLRMSAEETGALQRVSQVMSEQSRAMGVTTGAIGGFGLPITIDPSILLTSNGALCPIREVATVKTIATHEWRGITSAGVTAAYSPEATEASDNSPTLAQPVIIPAKGQCFVPFSMELGQDWTTLQQELLTLVSDAKDVLDSSVMLTGPGVNSPAGVQTGLTTAQRVLTNTIAVTAIGDVYALKAALPARWQPRASFLLADATSDIIYRFAGGGSTEPQLSTAPGGAILGKPVRIWSDIPSTTTVTGSKVAYYGDWSNYVIIDRIGMSVEIAPMLFGVNGRPTGQRGFYAYWRTGAAVTVPAGIRYLEVK